MVEVSLIPKKEKKETPLEDIALIALLGIFGLVVILSLGLFIYKNVLTGNMEKLDASLKAIEVKRDQKTEANFRNLKNKIENLKPIIANHVYSSKLFSFLENSALPKTQFLNLTVDLEKNALQAQIRTPDFALMSSQLAVWEKTPEIKSTELSVMALNSSGGVDLNVKLYFDPRIVSFSK